MTLASPQVTPINTISLQCADKNSLQALKSPFPLGPLDLVALQYVPIAVVFVYRNDGDAPDGLIAVERLQRSLERLLDYYPHLTGRIVIDQDDQSARIEQLGTGAKLVTADCSDPLEALETTTEDDKPGSLPRLIISNLPAGGNALLPPLDFTPGAISHNAILTVQHTRFACGSVAVGIRIPHIICDAEGFFQLTRDLTELYRGFRERDIGRSTVPVDLMKTPHIHPHSADLELSEEERATALEFSPAFFELSPAAILGSSEAPTDLPAPPVTGRMMRFSAEEIAAIKAEANAGSKNRPVSTFDALAAHLYQSVFRARVKLLELQGKSHDEAMEKSPRQFLTSANLRSRGQLDVPDHYFPNCVACPVFSLSANQLLTDALSNVAASVHDGIRPADPEEMKQTLRWIFAQPQKQRVQHRYRFADGGFMISQWSKFGMYRGNEFEVAPTLVSSPFTPISLVDGLAYLNATEDQLENLDAPTGVSVGSMDISLALSEPVWDILDQDERFRTHRKW